MFLMHLRFLGSMNHKLNIAKAGNGQLRVHKPGLDWQNVNFVLSENAWTYITLTSFFFDLSKLFTHYSCLRLYGTIIAFILNTIMDNKMNKKFLTNIAFIFTIGFSQITTVSTLSMDTGMYEAVGIAKDDVGYLYMDDTNGKIQRIDQTTGATKLLPANTSADNLPITQENIQDAVNLWVSDPSGAEAIYGHISNWDVSQ